MAKKKQARRPQLKLCAAAWTLTNYPSEAKQWSMDRKVRAAKDAGFDGFSAGADPEIAEACAKHGLQLVGRYSHGGRSRAGNWRLLRKLVPSTSMFRLCDHDTEIRKAVTVARAVMKAGKELKLKPAIEWHRDTCTETPEKGLALAEQYEKRYKEKLRTNFDHSHPAIIKQLRPTNFWERIAEYRTRPAQNERVDSLPHLYGQPLPDAVTNGRGVLDADFIIFPQALAHNWVKGQRGATELWAVVLGPKGSIVSPTCGRTQHRRAIEKAFKGGRRQRRSVARQARLLSLVRRAIAEPPVLCDR